MTSRRVGHQLSAWWLSPRRQGMQRLIAPWEYRYLRGFAVTRIVFCAIAAGNFSSACWELATARNSARRVPASRHA
jgi:hypothetical protein